MFGANVDDTVDKYRLALVVLRHKRSVRSVVRSAIEVADISPTRIAAQTRGIPVWFSRKACARELDRRLTVMRALVEIYKVDLRELVDLPEPVGPVTQLTATHGEIRKNVESPRSF